MRDCLSGDSAKLDDGNRHCFTLYGHDRDSGRREMKKVPVFHNID